MRIPVLSLALIAALTLQGQYSGDNVRYMNIALEELPDALRKDPGSLLLDVRSVAEFGDTCPNAGLKIGRFRGAVNIPTDSFASNYERLIPYRHRTIYVYCSHGQRSRHVSNQLADSGFTKLKNVNAGLSRFWHEHHHMSAVRSLVEREHPDMLISTTELCAKLQEGALVVDIRPDSVFHGLGPYEVQRARGRVRGALHIPFEMLEARAVELPQDRPLIFIDANGDHAPLAARRMRERGHPLTHALFGGFDVFRNTGHDYFPCADKILLRQVPYKVIPIEGLDMAAVTASGGVVLDIRSAEEFEGRHERVRLNLGRLRGPINAPLDEILAGRAPADLNKETPVLVMGRMGADTYKAANALHARGHKDVTVLDGSIWHLRWHAHNFAGKEHMEELVERPPYGP
ncbi:MAG: rhodanese-like domain-containing protein [Flavobacteriales bacterium]|nr:rhodanese-like domain-containing protein [Flavobacteriales bacterium]